MDDARPTWDARILGPTPDMTALPMDYEVGDEQFRFDDGRVWATMSVRGRTATIHEFYAHDKASHGGRTGLGRATLETLRPHFDHVLADGVGELTHPSDPGKPFPLHEQPAFLFWRAMMREGLIDEIGVMGCGTRIDRRNVGEPVTVLYGHVVEPDPRDVATAVPGR